MRRRLYWVLPDVESARKAADDLLLARVEDRHMHFLARRGTDLGDLHEASVLQKSDIRHAAILGTLLGAFIGAVAGWVLTAFPIERLEFGPGGFVLLTLFGAAFGLVSSTMVGSSVPNSHLRQFERDIEEGRILMMVDVPLQQVDRIQVYLVEKHPEAAWRGVDPAVPAFP